MSCARTASRSSPLTAGRSPSTACSTLSWSWWGGFFLGPVLRAVANFTSSDDSLTRSHGGAAAIGWTVALAFWAPFSAWVILFDGAEPTALLLALPVVLITVVGSSLVGTIQALRGRPVFVRPLSRITDAW